MNDQDRTSFDPRIADWLEGDPNTALEPTLEIVLAAFPSIRQRRAMRVPWRFPSMSTMPKLALGAAVVTAVALGGFMILRSPSTRPVVGVPGPTGNGLRQRDPLQPEGALVLGADRKYQPRQDLQDQREVPRGSGE